MNIGMNLPFLTWGLATNAVNAFSIKALDSEGELDLTGWDVRLVVETTPETVFNATVNTAVASWVLTESEASDDLVARAVRLEVAKDGHTYLWARGRVQRG